MKPSQGGKGLLGEPSRGVYLACDARPYTLKMFKSLEKYIFLRIFAPKKEKDMKQEKPTSKHVNFADGRQLEEVKSVLRELAPIMDKEDRKYTVRGILWCVRHAKTMHDDLEVLREQLAEARKGQPAMQEPTEEVTKIREEVTRLEGQTKDLARARDKALQDLDDLKAQFTQELAAPRDERTVEVARRMINAGKCPICSNQLVDSEDRGGNAMVRCTSCRYVVYGTIQEPKLVQK